MTGDKVADEPAGSRYSEMVERMAKVLAENSQANPDWRAWIDDARRVIAAMRAVTKEMADAGADELDNCMDEGFSSNADGERDYYTTVNSDAPAKIYIAMIDAALKPYEYVVAEGAQEKAQAILSGKGKSAD